MKYCQGTNCHTYDTTDRKRGTKGKCTPITKKGCTGRAKALAMTFKKMGKARKGNA